MRRNKKNQVSELYMLDSFSVKAKEASFYIEDLKAHLSNHAFVNNPHKHDFYLILFITRGGGTHMIDFIEYPVTARSVFAMTPGQIHSWKLDTGTEGFILFFHSDFYRMRSIDTELIDLPYFHPLNPGPRIELTESDSDLMNTIMSCMLEEFATCAEYSLQILRGYLEIILLKLSRNYKAIDTGKIDVTSYKLRKLEQLIDKHYLSKKQPRDYADLMNLSPSYLNTLTKKSIGKTLTDLISERLILEAKRFLSYSDLHVSEISNKLHFHDTSYFIRFFKKHTGSTPEQFKESIKRTAL